MVDPRKKRGRAIAKPTTLGPPKKKNKQTQTATNMYYFKKKKKTQPHPAPNPNVKAYPKPLQGGMKATPEPLGRLRGQEAETGWIGIQYILNCFQSPPSSHFLLGVKPCIYISHIYIYIAIFSMYVCIQINM